MPVQYLDRSTGCVEEERVYCKGWIRFFYGAGFLQRTVGRGVLHGIAKWPLFSWFAGLVQRSGWSRRKIVPFIARYGVDEAEFELPVGDFRSFNDFFVRRLKKEVRPIADAPVVIPADGRYRVVEVVRGDEPFSVKGREYTLGAFLGEDASRYEGGCMVIGRLSPADCHRFYFAADGVPGEPRWINGKLFSVNPIAVRDNPWIYCANLRMVTYLQTKHFGRVAVVEVGATTVGTIVQTFQPNTPCHKGDEKGYFAFGGSAIVMLFEPGRIRIAPDLRNAAGLEVRCLMGQPLATQLQTSQ